ncbi:tetratricopeptide repeat protein [Parapedobacter sp. 2B3]|uniref:tetratricopeptide repeat protein n=1 Tax=Parapedobacter sp. 2B3 TaxID=3342381 RepID=UPI0035B599BE
MSNRLQQLIEFLKESPGDAFLAYALATEHLKLGHTEDALRHYEALVNDHPDYVGTYYHLGKLYEALGRKADAEAIYESGMQAARNKRDMHALSELQGAYRLVTGSDDDDGDL